jgi:hypothetical protein
MSPGSQGAIARVAELMDVQAQSCATLGSALYADLMRYVAGDLRADGPWADLLAPYSRLTASDALALRLFAGVHAAVLSRQGGALAVFFPSVGGTYDSTRDSAAAGAALDDLLAQQPELIGAYLDHPPQTNEVGRSVALYAALLQLPSSMRLPLRLFEIGSSGGLNLCPELHTYIDSAGDEYGGGGSVPFVDAWSLSDAVQCGLAPWPDLRVSKRLGCDLAPIAVHTAEGRLRLTSYVWADQVDRFERLRLAIAAAQEARPRIRVEQSGAAEFLTRLSLQPGTTTVLWHSIMWQYLPIDEQRACSSAIAALGRSANEDAPFVHVRFEPMSSRPEAEDQFTVQVTAWPGGETRLLGTAPPHGLRVDLAH